MDLEVSQGVSVSWLEGIRVLANREVRRELPVK